MAGGIDWFRWHHGSVTDPKFQLVARKAGTNLATVIAVWAFVLEKASAADFRGCFGELDCEAIDCLYGLDDGTTEAVLSQMVERKLIADEYVVAWDKRQVKREREDSTNSERQSAFRAKQNQVTPSNANDENVTPSNASVSQKTPREEKRRVEKRKKGAKAPLSAELPTWMQGLIDLWHEVLPELPSVAVMNAERQQAAKDFREWVLTSRRKDGGQRATTDSEFLSWTRDFFNRARANDFLMGRGQRSPEHQNWRCSFEYLLSAKGMQKVIEQTQAGEN